MECRDFLSLVLLKNVRCCFAVLQRYGLIMTMQGDPRPMCHPIRALRRHIVELRLASAGWFLTQLLLNHTM